MAAKIEPGGAGSGPESMIGVIGPSLGGPIGAKLVNDLEANGEAQSRSMADSRHSSHVLRSGCGKC